MGSYISCNSICLYGHCSGITIKMIITTQLKLLIAVCCILFAGCVGYIAYDTIYDRGYAAAEAKFAEQQNKKIEEVTSTVTSLIAATSGYNTALIQDLAKIQSTLKGKPLVEYRDGKCQLTQDYKDARLQAIDRVNKK